jgi:arylsulfatase A
MKNLLSLMVLSLTTLCGAAEKPNIVILYADDMGYGDLAAQNPNSKIPTPFLDQLAAQGLRLTDGHSSSGICTPSRYALLTGRFHWRKFHGIVNSFGPPSFDDSELTLPEMAKSVGYKTACIGKWHLGWNWDAIRKPDAKEDGKKGNEASAFDWSKPIPGGPLSHGFDYYYGDDVPNFPPYTWFENDKVVIIPTESLSMTTKTAEGDWEARPGPMAAGWVFEDVMPTLTKKAVNFIAQQKGSDQPFLLYFPFTSPHAPILPTKEFIGSSKAGGYGDFMVQTDWTVGQVLKALDDHGLSANTIVIFSADNGPEKYAYDRIKKFDHQSASMLRGLKRDIWEGGHRVPFLVRWPGKVAPGGVSDGIISQVDIFATLAGVLGVDIPKDQAQDSYDQRALWTGTGPSKRTNIVHNTKANSYAIRSGDYVLIDDKSGGLSSVPSWFDEANGYSINTNPGELYNLKTDLSQKKNLYAEEPERVKELQALLKQLQDPKYSVR